MPRAADMNLRACDSLDVHQDRAGLEIARDDVEHVAKVDVGHVAHRHQMRKTDALRRTPVRERGQDSAGLRHRRDLSRLQIARPEARVEADARGGVPDAVGPDDAQKMGLCRLEKALAPLRVGHPRERSDAGTGGNDDGDLGTTGAEFGDHARHGLRRRHHDGKIGRRRKLGERSPHRAASDLAALHIHEINLTLESARQQVARHGFANRALSDAGADRHDRFGLDQAVEVTCGHELVLSPTIAAKAWQPSRTRTSGTRVLS